jgi:hypothetical protein
MKQIKMLVAMLLFSQVVFAACSVTVLKGSARDTNGKPIDKFLFGENETILIGFQASKDNPNIPSNLDITIKDPLQFGVYSSRLTFPVNISYAEIQLNVSSNYLAGVYTINANHTEFNNSIVTCTAVGSTTANMTTNRSSYNTSPITVSFTTITPLEPIQNCRSITAKGSKVDVCLNGTVPKGYDFTVDKITTIDETANDTNYSLLISTSTPWYSYDIVAGLLQKVNDYNTSNGELTKAVMDLTATNGAYANITAQQNIDQYNSLMTQYQTLVKEGDDKKSSSYWQGIFVGAVPGMVVGALLFYFYIWKKSKESAV